MIRILLKYWQMIIQGNVKQNVNFIEFLLTFLLHSFFCFCLFFFFFFFFFFVEGCDSGIFSWCFPYGSVVWWNGRGHHQCGINGRYHDIKCVESFCYAMNGLNPESYSII